MLRCIRLSITRFYTLRLDDENKNDLEMMELNGEELKQAIVDRIINDRSDAILDPDGDLDIEPQDITIDDEYFV